MYCRMQEPTDEAAPCILSTGAGWEDVMRKGGGKEARSVRVVVTIYCSGESEGSGKNGGEKVAVSEKRFGSDLKPFSSHDHPRTNRRPRPAAPRFLMGKDGRFTGKETCDAGLF